MKLSTLTTDLGLILDYFETNNIELYDDILYELGNSGTDKDDIRKITIVRLILTEFMYNLKFQAMFDYNRVELKKVLSALNKRETFLIIWNEICDITDITDYEYKIKNDDDSEEDIFNGLQKDEFWEIVRTKLFERLPEVKQKYIEYSEFSNFGEQINKEMAVANIASYIIIEDIFGCVGNDLPLNFTEAPGVFINEMYDVDFVNGFIKDFIDDTSKFKNEKDNQEYYGDFDDFDENSWDEMNATKGFENFFDEDEDDFVDYSDNAKHQIPTQQFIQQAVQQAQAEGQIIAPKVIKEETEAAKARRMNITVPQMRTLEAIKEKTRLSLKTPMSTKDKSGKNAKTKVMKFISFNPKFDKGMVFLEYPHLKDWLVTSMSASEFFRKFNIRLKK